MRQATVAGAATGQVNGLAVVELGDHRFGHPVRVTATVGPGHGRVIDIDREAELSGPVHDKGFLILAGLLRDRYCRDTPLALHASIVFEQSYSAVEGDSVHSFGSACHGAGRRMSRTGARRAIHGAELRRRLEADGIVVRCPSNKGLAEEAPFAYKDVEHVVAVVEAAGLADRVARLRPLGVVKG